MMFLKTTVIAMLGMLFHDVRGDDGFWFWKLGHLDGPHTSSKALGISRDGKTAVGATVVVDFERAWRCDIDWTISTTVQPPLYNELFVQEDVGVIAPSFPSEALAASDMTTDTCPYDKVALSLDWCESTVVGGYDSQQVSYAVQWLLPVLDEVNEDTDFIEIPDFGGGIAQARITDVSADGLVMVGYGHNRRGPVAFRAEREVVDEAGVPVLQTLTIQDAATLQTLQWAKAQAISEDGTIIAGFGGLRRGNRAFVTTVLDVTTNPITLESTILPMLGGGNFAEAYAMTPDGAVIAGRSDSPKGPQACIWFKSVDGTTGEDVWVVKGLGSLSQTNFDSVATGVAWRPASTSSVGELIVVGHSGTNLYASEAFVWAGNAVVEDDGIGYFYDLEYILTKTGVGEASGMGSDWVLNQATGISADGQRIVGWGINPEGGTEAWVVTQYPDGELVFTHE